MEMVLTSNNTLRGSFFFFNKSYFIRTNKDLGEQLNSEGNLKQSIFDLSRNRLVGHLSWYMH